MNAPRKKSDSPQKLTVLVEPETLQQLRERQAALKRDGLHVSLSSVAAQAIHKTLSAPRE